MNPKPDTKNRSLTPLILEAGNILFLFQQLESVIEMCCTFVQINGVNLTVNDLFSNESDKQHYTLGQMLVGMKKSIGFKQAFKERLTNFVKMRNTFIHNYWVKNHIHALDQLVDEDTFEEIASYENNLQKETIYMIQVFLGLNYSIGAAIATDDGKAEEFESNQEYDTMKQYTPHFLSVVE